MLKPAVVASVVLLGSTAAAIRWDFDDGTTQGWTAKEDAIWGGTREFHQLPGVVEDGVWRITVSPSVTKGRYSRPSVEVIAKQAFTSPFPFLDRTLSEGVMVSC